MVDCEKIIHCVSEIVKKVPVLLVSLMPLTYDTSTCICQVPTEIWRTCAKISTSILAYRCHLICHHSTPNRSGSLSLEHSERPEYEWYSWVYVTTFSRQGTPQCLGCCQARLCCNKAYWLFEGWLKGYATEVGNMILRCQAQSLHGYIYIHVSVSLSISLSPSFSFSIYVQIWKFYMYTHICI